VKGTKLVLKTLLDYRAYDEATSVSNITHDPQPPTTNHFQHAAIVYKYQDWAGTRISKPKNTRYITITTHSRSLGVILLMNLKKRAFLHISAQILPPISLGLGLTSRWVHHKYSKSAWFEGSPSDIHNNEGPRTHVLHAGVKHCRCKVLIRMTN